jgi:hypothetical protein
MMRRLLALADAFGIANCYKRENLLGLDSAEYSAIFRSSPGDATLLLRASIEHQLEMLWW